MEEQEVARPDAEALPALLANHREFLSFLERRVGDRAAAEDLLQEAFVRSLDRLPALARSESAVAWFYRVLRNAAIYHHRRNASRSRALAAFAAELSREAEPDQETPGALCACVSAWPGPSSRNTPRRSGASSWTAWPSRTSRRSRGSPRRTRA